MKKLLIIGLTAVLSTCLLSSCSSGRSIYEMEKDAKREAAFNDGYDVGYEEGYWEGYWEGVSNAQERLEDVIWNLSWETKNEHGISPETALQILTNYADGEPITEQELQRAIWAIKHYYWSSYDAVNDSDSYS